MPNHTETKIAKIPDCDLCPNEAKLPAVYDAFVPTYESWVYLCKTHFVEVKGELGLGKGQMLILKEEVYK